MILKKMKNIIILTTIILISCSQLVAQDTTQTKPTFYTCIGISLSNGEDFTKVCFPSIENGIMYKNFFGGLVFGRGNLYGMLSEGDNIENYFYEGKIGAYFPIGVLTGVIYGGYGGYFKPYNFIEYGGGITYTYKKVSFGLVYSNWDNVNYLTPSITYNW